MVLTVAGLSCALVSSAAFFLHVLGWIRMPFFVNFVGMPAIVLMLIVGLYSWQRQLPFWQRCRAGLLAGALGLLAYDLVRLAVYRAGIFDYYPFHAIAILGSLVTGRPATAAVSAVAGWAYHLVNGISFAMIYALLFGPVRWGWGIAWAMVLETGMLYTYPTFLAIQAGAPFIAVSLIGHTAYGAAVGLTVRHAAREVRV